MPARFASMAQARPVGPAPMQITSNELVIFHRFCAGFGLCRSPLPDRNNENTMSEALQEVVADKSIEVRDGRWAGAVRIIWIDGRRIFSARPARPETY